MKLFCIENCQTHLLLIQYTYIFMFLIILCNSSLWSWLFCIWIYKKGFGKYYSFPPSIWKTEGKSFKQRWIPPKFMQYFSKCLKIYVFGASLVAQWSRILLPVQGTRVRALVWEDPTCRGAAKPVRHNYWACALEPATHNYWACVPQLLKPVCLEPVLHNKRSHCNEKPTHRNRVAPSCRH